MSSDSVSSGFVSSRGLPTRCVCGSEVVMLTSKTQGNPGRPFFRCVSKRDVSSWTSKNDGHLFKWVEEAVYEEIESAVPKLAAVGNEICELKSEASELRSIVEEVKNVAVLNKEEIWKLKVFLIVGFVWMLVFSMALVYQILREGKKTDALFM